MKFKIGEFSKLCQVTVKTLRHYEEIGLLIPFEVDEWTGYRYYNISQLRQMNRIVYLKQLGFSLEEIGRLFEEGKDYPGPELIEAKVERCKEEIERLIRRQTELAKLEDMLRKQEKVMKKVFEKSLPARVFATHRRKIDSYQELFNLCPNVIGPEMYRLGCECPAPEYCFTIEYNEEYGVDIDIEYFEAVAQRKEDSELIKFKELPEVPVALCISHYGAYEKMPETFAELYAYAEANGYEVSDRPRFCYIDGIWNKESVEEWLTEIELPVKR
ncbi:MAG: MerR family transcriptional regulator [Bacteroides sp.]|nr:MerR family transcriptional regulator [Bacteroides sp.]MDD3038738.1 MerR family transcriptional regulator [Bacteroides sp.]